MAARAPAGEKRQEKGRDRKKEKKTKLHGRVVLSYSRRDTTRKGQGKRDKEARRGGETPRSLTTYNVVVALFLTTLCLSHSDRIDTTWYLDLATKRVRKDKKGQGQGQEGAVNGNPKDPKDPRRWTG